MRRAARTKLPVQTSEVLGTYGGIGVDAPSSLAAWIDPGGWGHLSMPSTVSLSQVLLAGWRVNGSRAVSPLGVTRIEPPAGGTGGELVVEEHRPTDAVRHLLQLAKSPLAQTRGPITLVLGVQSYPARADVRTVLGSIVQELQHAEGAGIPAVIYVQAPPVPAPAAFVSYAGPINPAEQLAPAPGGGEPGCSSGAGWLMGMRGGRIAPVTVQFAMQSTVTYGFAPGEFAVDSNHAGYDLVYWYHIAGITVPESARR